MSLSGVVRTVPLLLVTALAVVGCGTGGSKAPADGTDAQRPEGGVDLQTFVERFAEFRGRIEIRSSITNEGTGEGTLYLDPPRYRTDFGGGDLRVLTTPEGSYTCMALEGDGYCLSNEAQDGDIAFGEALSLDPRGIAALAEEFEGAEVEVTGARIADREATCFTASNLSEEADKTSLCFDVGGALLLWSEQSDDTTFEIRATQISDEVSDADFELPYEIREPTLDDIFQTQ